MQAACYLHMPDSQEHNLWQAMRPTEQQNMRTAFLLCLGNPKITVPSTTGYKAARSLPVAPGNRTSQCSYVWLCTRHVDVSAVSCHRHSISWCSLQHPIANPDSGQLYIAVEQLQVTPYLVLIGADHGSASAEISALLVTASPAVALISVHDSNPQLVVPGPATCWH
jgi:hypothetical protein